MYFTAFTVIGWSALACCCKPLLSDIIIIIIIKSKKGIYLL